MATKFIAGQEKIRVELQNEPWCNMCDYNEIEAARKAGTQTIKVVYSNSAEMRSTTSIVLCKYHAEKFAQMLLNGTFELRWQEEHAPAETMDPDDLLYPKIKKSA